MSTLRNIRDVNVGQGVIIRDFVNLYECTIGDHSRIGAFVEIQSGVTVGRNVKISSHTFICTGVAIEDDVFVGHNVSFINDLYPRATMDGTLQTPDDWECLPTAVKRGASIGTSATILAGLTIGQDAIVGAGSVVTRDVPEGAIVVGNPARIVRWIDKESLRPSPNAVSHAVDFPTAAIGMSNSSPRITTIMGFASRLLTLPRRYLSRVRPA